MDAQAPETLREIDDPKPGVNLVELGLVYAASRESQRIAVQLTATSRSCPLGEYLREEARAFPEISFLDVELVWAPAWSPARMTSAGRAELGL